MHDHKKENLEEQLSKMQTLVGFYREDWKAMIKQLEEAEERSAYWHDQYMKSVTGSDVKV